MRTIVVHAYDPGWPSVFERLRAHVWPAVRDLAMSIEHVGSTAVPGMAAKPIIDMSIVVASRKEVPTAIDRVVALGYRHEGFRGVDDRDAFLAPSGLPPHNLYLCPQGTIGIVNQLAVRDYLRAHPDTAREYGELKKRLAREFPHDIDEYVWGKNEIVLRILRAAGVSADEVAAIERANRRPGA